MELMHDDISIRILKSCDSGIAKTLLLISGNCSRNRIFPTDWKKSNFANSKKNEKQSTNNYKSISLVLICGKNFEKNIFNAMFKFLASAHQIIALINHYQLMMNSLNLSRYF